MCKHRLLLAAGLLPVLVHAQTAAAVTITNANLTYTQSAISLTETVSVGEALNGSGGDILYQHWWWFRVGGDTREFAFKRNATATRVLTNAATMVTTWPDVDARGVFSAQLTQVAVGTGTTGGHVAETMVVSNLTNAPITIDLFSYTDFDVAGAGTDLARGNASSQVVIDAANTMLGGEFQATSAASSQVAAFATIQALLQNATVDNLTGWNNSFGPADFTGAYQWTLSLPANGSATVNCRLVTLACRPSATTYGVGTAGTNGIPTIWSEFPVLRAAPSPTVVRLENGASNVLAALLLNLGPTNQVLFGINILVDPVGVTSLFAATSAVGSATYALSLPGNPVFCGVKFFGQWLVSDPLGGGGLAASSSGLEMTLGSW